MLIPRVPQIHRKLTPAHAFHASHILRLQQLSHKTGATKEDQFLAKQLQSYI
jgi:hypothetical protein